jgi:predicted Zn-dependent protease
MQIDFTRDNEQEADRIGIKTLERSGFDPLSMPAFFEKLQLASRYYGEGAPEFLRLVITSEVNLHLQATCLNG